MKHIFSTIILSTILTTQAVRASESLFSQRDKHAHIIGASQLTLSGSMAFERLLHQSKTISAIESAACVLTLATLKELIIDSKFETSDMSANLIGIAGGVGLYYIIPFD